MDLRRYVGLIDLGILTVVVVMIILPPREMYASNAIKGDELAMGLAEARVIAHPKDGAAVEELGRRLAEAGMKDWAIETTQRASERAAGSPTRWRALLATSVAYVDHLDVVPGLDYANRALSACESAREKGDAAACPSWEEIRMQLYQQHLDAGVKSGIDPKRGPAAAAAFRHAGESALRQIYIGGHHEQSHESTGSAAGSGTSRGTGAGSGSGSAP